MSEMRIVRPRGPLLTPRRFVIAFGVLAILGLAWSTNWFGIASPQFVPNVNYKFVDSRVSTHPVDKMMINGRAFIVDDQTVFSTPSIGPRGERFLAYDPTLPPNTFRLVKKTAPKIVVGGTIFQEAYVYTEVRFRQDRMEPQSIVPHIPPKR